MASAVLTPTTFTVPKWRGLRRHLRIVTISTMSSPTLPQNRRSDHPEFSIVGSMSPRESLKRIVVAQPVEPSTLPVISLVAEMRSDKVGFDEARA